MGVVAGFLHQVACAASGMAALRAHASCVVPEPALPACPAAEGVHSGRISAMMSASPASPTDDAAMARSMARDQRKLSLQDTGGSKQRTERASAVNGATTPGYFGVGLSGSLFAPCLVISQAAGNPPERRPLAWHHALRYAATLMHIAGRASSEAAHAHVPQQLQQQQQAADIESVPLLGAPHAADREVTAAADAPCTSPPTHAAAAPTLTTSTAAAAATSATAFLSAALGFGSPAGHAQPLKGVVVLPSSSNPAAPLPSHGDSALALPPAPLLPPSPAQLPNPAAAALHGMHADSETASLLGTQHPPHSHTPSREQLLGPQGEVAPGRAPRTSGDSSSSDASPKICRLVGVALMLSFRGGGVGGWGGRACCDILQSGHRDLA